MLMGKYDSDPRVRGTNQFLARVIRESDLRQFEVERAAGYSRHYLSQVMNGAVRLTVEHIARVGDALKIQLPDMLRQVADYLDDEPGTVGRLSDQELERVVTVALERMRSEQDGNGDSAAKTRRSRRRR